MRDDETAVSISRQEDEVVLMQVGMRSDLGHDARRPCFGLSDRHVIQRCVIRFDLAFQVKQAMFG